MGHAYKWGLPSLVFPILHSLSLTKKTFSDLFPFFADPLFLSYLGLEGQLYRAHGMLQGGSFVTSPLALWRPPKSLVEKAVQDKLEVKDVEFKEGRMEVVWLVVNPHQLSRSWVSPCQVHGGRSCLSL